MSTPKYMKHELSEFSSHSISESAESTERTIRKEDNMSDNEKKKIIDDIIMLLTKLIDIKENDGFNGREPVEMLTIKECTDAVSGLSEHTVRKLVAQGKAKYIRTGEGKRGKILVNKADLLGYFQR